MSALMTDRQKELARHALGLPQKSKTSYRNRFYAGPGHADYPYWVAMVEAGHAEYDGCFYLTRRGAELALLPGEKLDREDFPK